MQKPQVRGLAANPSWPYRLSCIHWMAVAVRHASRAGPTCSPSADCSQESLHWMTTVLKPSVVSLRTKLVIPPTKSVPKPPSVRTTNPDADRRVGYITRFPRAARSTSGHVTRNGTEHERRRQGGLEATEMSPSGRIPPVGDGEGDSEGEELVGGVCPPSEELTPRVQAASSTKKLIRKGAEEYPVRPFRARGMHRLYRLIDGRGGCRAYQRKRPQPCTSPPEF